MYILKAVLFWTYFNSGNAKEYFQVFNQIDTGLLVPHVIENLQLGKFSYNPTRKYKIICNEEIGDESKFDNDIWVTHALSSYLLYPEIIVIIFQYDHPEEPSSHIQLKNIARRYTNSNAPNPTLVLNNIKKLGKIMGELIIALNQTKHVPLDNMHVIGSRNGNLINTYAAKWIFLKTLMKVNRLTYLMPFTGHPSTVTLVSIINKKYAQFVDSLHAYDNLLYLLNNTLLDLSAHVNFRCLPSEDTDRKTGEASKHKDRYRFLASNYFVESIIINKFKATKCSDSYTFCLKSCRNNERALLGEHTSENTSGTFFIFIKPSPPNYIVDDNSWDLSMCPLFRFNNLMKYYYNL